MAIARARTIKPSLPAAEMIGFIAYYAPICRVPSWCAASASAKHQCCNAFLSWV